MEIAWINANLIADRHRPQVVLHGVEGGQAYENPG